MSDQERDELTTEQPVASDQQEQTQPEMEGQSVQAEEGLQIPQKFLESSKIDVIQAYQEIEKDRGRIASELGDLRKEREELEEKYRQLEVQRMQSPPVQTQPTPQQVQPQQELDPLSVLDSKFEDDPQGAIREAMKRQREILESQVQMNRLQEQSTKAQDYYYNQKKDNPDFARRESAMQTLAQQYGHMVKPEFLNSPEMIKILDLASQGSDIDYYKKSAIDEAQTHRAAVLEEKRRAQSVSSHSEGDSTVDVKKMSNDEYIKTMQELYGYADNE